MIRLEKLTWDNYDDVLKLKVAKEQKEYMVPNAECLIQAFFAMTESKAQVFPFGIYSGKKPVGFMMIARDVPWIEEYCGSHAKILLYLEIHDRRKIPRQWLRKRSHAAGAESDPHLPGG